MSATDQVSSDMHPQRLKHLEMLQQVISRLANNSFAIKGWSATLTSALLALAAATKNNMSVMVLISNGILAKIAQIFEKYIEGKKTEVLVKAADGSSIELRANMSAGDIQSILREVNRRDSSISTLHTDSPHH